MLLYCLKQVFVCVCAYQHVYTCHYPLLNSRPSILSHGVVFLQPEGRQYFLCGRSSSDIIFQLKTTLLPLDFGGCFHQV